MKSPSLHFAATVAALTIAVATSRAEPPTIKAAAKAAPVAGKQKVEDASAASRAETSFARSEFTLPRKPAEGRDPFFPSSPRPYASDNIAKPTSEPTMPEVEFSLKGISGTPEQPLAIINTTTFTRGEENEVIINSKRIKIRCAEINMSVGTAIIEYAGSRRLLKLQNR